VEVHSVRPALRRTADGSVLTDLVVEVVQSRRGYFNPEEQHRRDDRNDPASREDVPGDFVFRRGSTILIDPRRSEIRRVMSTRDTIAGDSDGKNPELDRVRSFLTGGIPLAGNAFDAGLANSLRVSSSARREPFALVHQLEEA